MTMAAVPPQPQGSRPAMGRLLLVGAALLLAWSIVANAWLGDDAFISLRTVHHWLEGHGLRWNTDERTQTFTHPLWLLLLSAAALPGGAGYGTAMVVSLAVSSLALAGLAALARSAVAAAVLLLVVAHCRCLVDYSTSGLENPLTHLLAVALAASFLHAGDPGGRLRWCAAVTGLSLCNRIDLLWLCLPPLAAAALALGPRRALPVLLAGLAPFAAWIAFATFYYGNPLPVTAHAKALATGIPAGELAVQGLRYTADFALRDPTAAAVLLLGLVWLPTRSARAARPLLLGAALYSAYVIKVGGDFMAGRFFTAPVVLVLAVLAHRTASWTPTRRWLAGGGLALLGLVPGAPPWATTPAGAAAPPDLTQRWGIGDERRVYQGMLGLLSPGRVTPVPGLMTAQLRAAGQRDPVVWVDPFVGVRGYLAGPQVHLVDPLLCDPLLARLPNPPGAPWRVGHVQRRIPEGYLESLASGENRIHHPGLRRYWQALRSATRDPLWSWQRLGTALALLAGSHAQDLQDYIASDYATPPLVRVPAAALTATVADGTPWYRCAARVVLPGGLEIVFSPPASTPRVHLVLDAADRYRVQFRGDERVLHEVTLASQRPPHAGAETHSVDLPDAARAFDRIRILAEPGGDFVAAVAAVAVDR